MIQRFYPEMGVHPFHRLLAEAIQQAHVVLDAGCGDGRSFRYSQESRAGVVFGVDLLWRELIQNRQVSYACVADLEHLPFADQSFDLVFSHDVLEHLKCPSIVFTDFSRVLRPGGKLILLTPNNYHYFVIAGRVIPHSLQKVIARRWMGSLGEVFKTYYRCNSAKGLAKMAVQAGINPVSIRSYEPPPKYMAMSSLTFYPAVVYERLVNRYEWLALFRAQLIGIFQKEQTGGIPDGARSRRSR